MKIIDINFKNIDKEHICCAIGNDKQNQIRSQSKKEWMKQRFEDGLIFKRFDQRGKIFIEYMPIEKVWKPITGYNYMVINCLWVSGQFKGKGLSTQLLNECIADSQAQGKDGVVVVTSTKIKPFLTDKKFFQKHGFLVVDNAAPYFELLALKFNAKTPNPKFSDYAKTAKCSNSKGFTFIYSNQCPFMQEYVEVLATKTKDRNIPTQVIKLETYQDAQKIGSPFGTLGIYYNGKFVAHELMPEKRFEEFIIQLVNK